MSDVKASPRNKPAAGPCRRRPMPVAKRFVREWRLRPTDSAVCRLGDDVNVSVVCGHQVCGCHRHQQGQGYAGVMKRHHFGGFPGIARYRAQAPCRRFNRQSCQRPRSRRKPEEGQDGWPDAWAANASPPRITSLYPIDQENNLLVVKGAVPGRPAVMCRSAVRKTRPQKHRLATIETGT